MMMNKPLVLGTAGLGGVWGAVDPAHSITTVLAALEYGVDGIDTAPAYGDAEAYVGAALRQWKGTMPMLSSKVGRLKSYAADEGHYDYTPEGMTRSVGESLQTLGVSCLDTLFIHDPQAIPVAEVERVMTTLAGFRDRGWVQRLGVGGNWPVWMKKYLDEGWFDVMMEYNRVNACCTEGLTDSLPYCMQHGLQYFVASPLNMGLLGRCIRQFREMRPAWLEEDKLMTAARLEQLAGDAGLTLPAMAHRFLLSLPYSFTIVIGASDTTELENTWSDFASGPLPEQLMQQVLSCISDKKQGDV
ncbi:aldo/keto reductase [Chitinophaga qingshengii]|uniref:Aldo/keto reductase n=1 Tax=Chitinophaga qingshengii TaxID=1569794 RepID=A0ABR7TNJ6_9BACT|nr:aldo/keto reductase [Chitinophaga qingshengii]MBC9930594.1 aldo/keto reductase [Chitinophaga qingshengii]